MSKKRNGAVKTCIACHAQFYVSLYRIESAKFCSVECQNHKQYENPTFKCKNCEKEFTDSPSRVGKRIFCSFECCCLFKQNNIICRKKERRDRMTALREKGSVNLSPQNTRKFVFSVKNSRCQVCDYSEHKECLDIHHIDHDANNNIIENLAVLCVMCHRKVHRNIINIGEPIKTKMTRLPKKNSKLNSENVHEIKKLLNDGVKTQSEIAEMFGIRREMISKIHLGKRWSDVG